MFSTLGEMLVVSNEFKSHSKRWAENVERFVLPIKQTDSNFKQIQLNKFPGTIQFQSKQVCNVNNVKVRNKEKRCNINCDKMQQNKRSNKIPLPAIHPATRQNLLNNEENGGELLVMVHNWDTQFNFEIQKIKFIE